MARTRNIRLCTSILFIQAVTACPSCAGVQPISFFKKAPDVNGFGAVAADSFGVYAVSTGGVRRYDLQGTEVWIQSFDAPSSSVQAASDSTGVYVLVTPSPPPGSVSLSVLYRYSAAGARLWSRNLASYGMLAADGAGVYVLISSTGGGLVMVKYGPDNLELWAHSFNLNEVRGFGRIVGTRLECISLPRPLPPLLFLTPYIFAS
jgi:hypothetical protein